MHLDIQRCHQKYGDVIRYSPSQVLTLHPEDLFKIYGHGQPFRKSKGYKTMIPIPDGWSAMTSIDKSLHHDLRRVFRLGVGADSLARYEPAILRHLDIYFSELMKSPGADGWSRPADMRKWSAPLPRLRHHGGLRAGAADEPAAAPRAAERAFVFPALYVHEKKMGFWEQLPGLASTGLGTLASYASALLSPSGRRFARWFHAHLRTAIRANTAAPRGIFGPVIQSGQGVSPPEKQRGHNRAQMVGEGAFSTFSSADAYGIVLSGFLHYLARSPGAYARLAGEVRGAFAAVAWGPALEGCAYLRAVLDEVMRLLPPACGVHWREAEAAGVSVGGGPDNGPQVPLPVGTDDVGVSLFALFRDARVFRAPLRFWPERWLPGTTLGAGERRRARRAFAPFLLGPRNCAGSHVAVMVASVAYAHVLVNYDFRLAAQQPAPSPRLWSNARPGEPGADGELRFESHYSIAGWESGPFIQFRRREPGGKTDGSVATESS
ncbi:benzoate 4-monooxygenase cytochrome P450 [Xylariomycetidae sp. FL0641]|nr:benzoate 4-monooxygenase cytochrome P450 [Xylariomycetidae sp. FL0641]